MAAVLSSSDLLVMVTHSQAHKHWSDEENRHDEDTKDDTRSNEKNQKVKKKTSSM